MEISLTFDYYITTILSFPTIKQSIVISDFSVSNFKSGLGVQPNGNTASGMFVPHVRILDLNSHFALDSSFLQMETEGSRWLQELNVSHSCERPRLNLWLPVLTHTNIWGVSQKNVGVDNSKLHMD